LKVAHFLFVCNNLLRQLDQPRLNTPIPSVLVSYVICFLACFGGGILNGLITGTGLPFVKNDQFMISFVLICSLLHLKEARSIVSLYPLQIALIILEMIHNTNSQFGGYTLSKQLNFGLFGQFLLTTVGGCGGAILSKFALQLLGFTNIPSELTNPTWSVKRASLGGVFIVLCAQNLKTLFGSGPLSFLSTLFDSSETSRLFSLEMTRLFWLTFSICHAVGLFVLSGPPSPNTSNLKPQTQPKPQPPIQSQTQSQTQLTAQSQSSQPKRQSSRGSVSKSGSSPKQKQT